jgi:prolipoprotein diacylglyceryltransferase
LILVTQLRRTHRDGQVIGLYALLYGFVRFAVEFLREHDASNPLGGPFTLEQWISLALAAGGVFLIARHARSTIAGTAPAVS